MRAPRIRSPKLNRWSLAANLALAALVLFLVKTRPASPEMSAETDAETAAAEVAEPAPPAPQPKTIVVTNKLQWAQLESEDYRTYIKRLRAIGCPEQTIRDIIIADLDKMMAPKVRSIYGRRSESHYWNSEEEELANNHDHREWLRQEHEIDREKREIIQELVGADLVRERLKLKGYEDYYERRLSFLPEEKRDSVRVILDKYDDQQQEIRGLDREGEPLSAEDASRLRSLEEQRQAELAAVLSPEEREQYELWLSPTANTVRYAMYGMNATEQEFRSVYDLQRAFDDKWGDPEAITTSDSATLLAWQKEREELDTQVRQQLGEQRYAEYKRGEDPEFHSLNSVVSRYKLPRETAAEAYEVKRTIQQMTAALKANTQISAEAREEALQSMAKETDFKLRQLLGGPGYRYFQQHTPPNWIGK